MKNKKLNSSIVVLLLFGVALLSAAVTKTLLNPKNSQPTPQYSYNNIALTGTPINNGEFIFGGGTYRDVNLKLKLKIPVGWSISLGGSGNLAEEKFETQPLIRITSNNQQSPSNRNFSETELIEQISIRHLKYDPLIYTSYEDAINKFSKMKNDKNVVAMKDEEFILANKYKAHRFDVEYNESIFSTDGDGAKSPMRFRTVVYFEYKDKLYNVEAINTSFYSSPQVQEMLNSIEFYE